MYYRYIFPLPLYTLVLDYTKDIDFKKILIIRRTQTKNTKGKSRLGKTSKTFSGKKLLI